MAGYHWVSVKGGCIWLVIRKILLLREAMSRVGELRCRLDTKTPSRWGGRVNFGDDDMCGKWVVRGRKEVFFVNFRAFERGNF